MSVFSKGKYIEAIKTFIDLDVNPAKVVALYPESVAGRLSTPSAKWIQLFGGKPPQGGSSGDTQGTAGTGTPRGTGQGLTDQIMNTLEALVPAIPDAIPAISQARRDDDVKSIQSLQVSVRAGAPVKGTVQATSRTVVLSVIWLRRLHEVNRATISIPRRS